MFSGCPSVRPSVYPFVRSSAAKLVNMIFWKRMNRFWCKLAQVVYNARAWNCLLVSGVRRSEHIIPVLEDLHWRVVFKMALMVWKCVHGVVTAYLSVPATAISGRQHLRSAAPGTLLVPRARTATGRRSFAVNGRATWNSLPPALRSPDLSESAFKRALNTRLFSTARRHWNVFINVKKTGLYTS